MTTKIRSVEEAATMIKNGDVVATSGFLGIAHPDTILAEIEKRFLEKETPKDLTLIYAAGQGDGKDKGLNHLGHEKLLSRVIAGHWNLAPKLQKLALENKISAYNLPQGTISQLFRDIAAGKIGTITHVGLKTFVDPRLEGGKINEKANKDKDLVTIVNIEGHERLLYKAIPINVAILKGTYSDEKGNITMEEEAASLENLSIAQAARNSGGKVIVQVKKVVQNGSLDPKLVKIPGIYVDAIVVDPKAPQTFAEQYDSSYCGKTTIPLSSVEKMPLNQRKIIARRAAMELPKDAVVNLGIGVPEGVAAVANEEGIGDTMTLTVEAGPIGGVPAGGPNFGASTNAECILDQPYQFDFYDGGGLDVAFLGLAQCDEKGNINVSKFGPKIAGCGGFINITQNAKKVVYCGTFTAGGLKVSTGDGKLTINQDGKVNKFIKDVEQITFSAEYAKEVSQPVLYITERAVFELRKEGLVLIEIAPGVDLEKDVLARMDFKPIVSKDLKVMDERIFKDEIMGLC